MEFRRVGGGGEECREERRGDEAQDDLKYGRREEGGDRGDV